MDECYDGPTKESVKRKAEQLGVRPDKTKSGKTVLPKGVDETLSATTAGKLYSRNLISEQMYEDAIRFRAKHRKAWGNVEPKTSLRRGGRMGDMKANLIAVARTRLQKELLYLERMFEDAGEKDAYRFLIATISHDKDYWQYGGPSDEEIERLNKALMILGIIFKEGRRARIR